MLPGRGAELGQLAGFLVAAICQGWGGVGRQNS